jgi:hypothetical protein
MLPNPPSLHVVVGPTVPLTHALAPVAALADAIPEAVLHVDGHGGGL